MCHQVQCYTVEFQANEIKMTDTIINFLDVKEIFENK